MRFAARVEGSAVCWYRYAVGNNRRSFDRAHPTRKRSGSESLCGRFAQDDILKFMNNPGLRLHYPRYNHSGIALAALPAPESYFNIKASYTYRIREEHHDHHQAVRRARTQPPRLAGYAFHLLIRRLLRSQAHGFSRLARDQ